MSIAVKSRMMNYIGIDASPSIPPRSGICIPSGDSQMLIFSVYDEDGDEVDLSDVSDISFIVSTGELFGGNIYAGGGVIFEKRKSTGGITVLNTLYQFSVNVTRADSAKPVSVNNYFEARIYTSSGTGAKVVSNGVYFAQPTQTGAS